MERTTTNIDGRFHTGPHKDHDVKLPESKSMAIRRPYQDDKFAEAYCQKMEDYTQKGYAIGIG